MDVVVQGGSHTLLDSPSHRQGLPTRLASGQALWCVCVRQPQIPDYQEME